ncbi:hypothetical protein K493DRAFT_287935 [Basidiobolus meristosporus CBS 931.73]|uniref:Uncharacterized protein n=1 Tax=Basidiobolus meristosporus CBS 931.73 TaxID=1314790 RepID=A0A1Y1XXQ2_9FUNG|nr:hypothetical protein K493DRAFT_287935 [Basidiobolus meristosporus CBS 931.73]|eukprot:ORX90522.1 hypothetical protein K493DRAFT_287935 [Basidiobolus meristosporus CBS 931.73]
MTISLKNIVVWSPSPDPKSPNYAFLEGTVPMLRTLSRLYDLYLLMQMSSPEERQQIIHLFTSAGLFRASKPGREDWIDRSRLVFCQSPEGKEYIARNLCSFVHIDDDLTTIRNLTPFVKRFIWVRRTSRDRQYNSFDTKPYSPLHAKNEPKALNSGLMLGHVSAKSVWSEVLASNLDHLEICDDVVKSSINPNRSLQKTAPFYHSL